MNNRRLIQQARCKTAQRRVGRRGFLTAAAAGSLASFGRAISLAEGAFGGNNCLAAANYSQSNQAPCGRWPQNSFGGPEP